MAKVDVSAIGAGYRSEADKAFSKALAFAVILILAHLLEIRPSEMDAFGLKVSFSEPALLYGAIAMVFGYYASRALDYAENGASLVQINVKPHKLRSNIRGAKALWKADKANKGKSLDHRQIKKSARNAITFGNILIAPYFIFAALFVIAAIPTSVYDLYNMGKIILERNLESSENHGLDIPSAR